MPIPEQLFWFPEPVNHVQELLELYMYANARDL